MWELSKTREGEIGCDECLEEVEPPSWRWSWPVSTPPPQMPLVQDHLEKCGDCQEEFEALLQALHASEGSNCLWARLRRLFGAT